MPHVVVDNDGEAVEIEEGRGDLTYSSEPYLGDDGAFLGSRPISFAKAFATQPWVAIAVMRLMTWAIRVPLKVYRRVDADGERVRLRPGEHPLADAIHAPWERGSMADLTMALLGPLCVHGNSLLDIDEGAGGKLRFDEIDWRTVAPIRLDESDPHSEIVGWKIHNPSGRGTTRSAETVMHLRWWSPLGKVGVSPLLQLRSSLTAERAAVEWQLSALRQAGPGGVAELGDEALALPEGERQQAYDLAVEALRKNYSGRENAGKLPVMPPGIKWVSADATNAVEAELISQRAINRNEVAAVYMLPPPTIGQLERATFNNIVELRQMAYTDGLAPPLVLIEQLINAHIVHELLREPDIFVEYDLGLILRGDRLKEIKALREGVSSAMYTPNEARGALNLPPAPEAEADKLFIPSNNLRPLGERDDQD